jgi:hypothetical protein
MFVDSALVGAGNSAPPTVLAQTSLATVAVGLLAVIVIGALAVLWAQRTRHRHRHRPAAPRLRVVRP